MAFPSLFSAFSVFAFVEYLVAGANMYFYYSISEDLPEERLAVLSWPSSGTSSSTSKEDTIKTVSFENHEKCSASTSSSLVQDK